MKALKYTQLESVLTKHSIIVQVSSELIDCDDIWLPDWVGGSHINHKNTWAVQLCLELERKPVKHIYALCIYVPLTHDSHNLRYVSILCIS